MIALLSVVVSVLGGEKYLEERRGDSESTGGSGTVVWYDCIKYRMQHCHLATGECLSLYSHRKILTGDPAIRWWNSIYQHASAGDTKC